ncbi:MAG: hypothetical protein ACK5XF_01750 [Neisseriaceae bacterium]
MNTITLIHPFEVPKDEYEKFLAIWNPIDEYMQKQDDFISRKLYQLAE